MNTSEVEKGVCS